MLRLRDAAGPDRRNFDPSHMFWQQADPVEAIAHWAAGALFHVHAKDMLNRSRATPCATA